MDTILEGAVDLFLSTFETKIDKKGRISIPARYRSLLEKSKEDLILFTTPETSHIQGCGNNYINRLWETNLELDQISNEALYIQDIMSDSIHVKIDPDGRILLSNKHIDIAGLDESVLFAGRGETFQIWNPDRFIEKKEERAKKIILSGPQSLMLKNKKNHSNE